MVHRGEREDTEEERREMKELDMEVERNKSMLKRKKRWSAGEVG